MGERVAIARAAQLLGIKRTDIQRLVQNGELEAFEGKVDLAALTRRFPRLAFRGPNTVERARLIRAGAFARRVSQVVVPDTDTLENQLRRRNADLSVQKARAKAYYAVIDQLLRHLGEMSACEQGERLRLVEEINQWLLQRLPE